MIQRRFQTKLFLKPVSLFIICLLFSPAIVAQNLNSSFQEISKDSTFDVVTWNVEWFGNERYGPEDDDLQLSNVIKVIKTIDADLYAFQEISNQLFYLALDDSLENYRGFYALYGQTQRTAYLFKTSVVDSLDSGLLEAQQNDYDWASGRFPLFFEFDVTISDHTLRVFSYNIHAKAYGDETSYNRRKNAANSLKEYLDRSRQNASVIVMGDFNDMLTESTFQGEPSPYDVFVDDDFYLPLTKPLEEEGQASYLDEDYLSFIDHMIVTNVLKNIRLSETPQVVNVDFIENYQSTTSDHAPVWSRFDFTKNFDDTFEELPEEFAVGPNYPNPFNPSTTIPFELDEPANVTVTVYDMMGREISILAKNQSYEAGEHTLPFNASGLTSGVYLYRVELNTDEMDVQKMTLIK